MRGQGWGPGKEGGSETVGQLLVVSCSWNVRPLTLDSSWLQTPGSCTPHPILSHTVSARPLWANVKYTLR